jgi:hypothetical protein
MIANHFFNVTTIQDIVMTIPVSLQVRVHVKDSDR